MDKKFLKTITLLAKLPRGDPSICSNVEKPPPAEDLRQLIDICSMLIHVMGRGPHRLIDNLFDVGEMGEKVVGQGLEAEASSGVVGFCGTKVKLMRSLSFGDGHAMNMIKIH
ncbi:hypothetical protein JTE90_010633 [Oedothorax gibbosus]|uniref:Uncharacterized protein n=1 Tax=Oedothorax gibbosus TaxID=931172 RepID=A0AAV6VGS3_9ARAC|nr:hypothetical protein JTE90_010633 [Oedothorax gibbosus]